MSREFVVVDKLNSVAFSCFSLVRFKLNNNDYLLYYFVGDGEKCNVFVSKIFSNSFNNYSLSDISLDEKQLIYNIIYSVFVTFPSSYSKDLDINRFVNDFTVNNNLIFLKEMPKFNEQSLLRNSFFATSECNYINYVRSFYDYILSNYNTSTVGSMTWSIPSSIDDISTNRLDSVKESSNVNKNGLMDNLDVIIPISGSEINTFSDLGNVSTNSTSNVFANFNKTYLLDDLSRRDGLNSSANDSFYPKKDLERYSASDFGFYYDPSMDDNNMYKNSIYNRFLDEKKAGFASNHYIIIGTLCYVLAYIVVFAFIIIIKNL